MDLSSVVSSFALEDGISITRRNAPTFTHGVMTAEATASTFVPDPVVVHPLTGRALSLLPEGQRTREPIAVITVEPLRGVQDPGGAQADRFDYLGNTYEVQTVERWAENANFYRSVAVKVPVT